LEETTPLKELPMKTEKILTDKYGVGVAVAPACAILWAINEAFSSENDRFAELVRVNSIRRKHGKPAVYFDTVYV